VVAKLMEILAMSKQRSQRFLMERFSCKKLNQLEGNEQYHAEVCNRFAAFKALDVEVDINSAWETIRENIKLSVNRSLGYFELKKHKPRLDEGCSKL
jgi:hypothetical protein